MQFCLIRKKAAVLIIRAVVGIVLEVDKKAGLGCLLERSGRQHRCDDAWTHRRRCD